MCVICSSLSTFHDECPFEAVETTGTTETSSDGYGATATTTTTGGAEDELENLDINGQTGTSGNTATGNQDIDGLLHTTHWSTTNLTYSFTNSSSDYGYNFNNVATSNFDQLNAAQQQAFVKSTQWFEAVSGLRFTELTGADDRNATIKVAESSVPGTAFAYLPHTHEAGGDVWLGNSQGYYENPTLGSYAFHTIVHELGHAVGLKHGHETTGFGALEADHDSNEYSIMTYRNYVGQSANSGYAIPNGQGVQSLMLADIAAVQEAYGANFSHEAGDTVYTFSETTGQFFINGVAQDASSAQLNSNTIFRTIWDGDGEDTYDFSNYSSDLDVDLRPGEWSTTDEDQLASLSYEGHTARGNIANAYQYNGDSRSLIENAVGGVGDDVLQGNQAGNRLEGGAGDDTLRGDKGDDTLLGGAGSNILDGGEGQDRVSYEDAFDGIVANLAGNAVTTNSGTDTLISIEAITGSAHADDFAGSNASDDIAAGAGDDTIDGGAGADIINAGAGDDFIRGGLDGDIIDGGDGFDWVDYSHHGNGISVDLNGPSGTFDTLTNIERVTGTTGDDHFIGNVADNIFHGGDGLDTIDGGAGDDRIAGGAGADILTGGDGHDLLDYSASSAGITAFFWNRYVNGGDATGDTVSGFEGIIGSNSNDFFIGDKGAETFIANDGADIVYAGSGDDIIDTGAGNDLIRGDAGADIINAGAGTDTIHSYYDGDVIDGGAGHDIVYYYSNVGLNIVIDGDEAGYTQVFGIEKIYATHSADRIIGNDDANFLNGYSGDDIFTGNGGADVLRGDSGQDQLFGGAGADQLFGGEDNDLLDGGSHNDYLYAGSGDDTINGGSGNDVIRGDGGVDTINGGAGNDRIYSYADGDHIDGGDGIDWAFFDQTDTAIDVNLLAATADAAMVGAGSITNVEHIVGSRSSDSIVGDENDNYFYGRLGDDTIDGGAGNDILRGENGSDTIIGGQGNDILKGGSENDRLEGGAGNDQLFGDSGEDVFVFGEDFGYDLLFDFTAGEDTVEISRDVFIDFDALFANALQSGTSVQVSHENDRITFLSTDLADLSEEDFLFF